MRAKAHWPHPIDTDFAILKEPLCALDFSIMSTLHACPATLFFFWHRHIGLSPCHEANQATCSTARNRPHTYCYFHWHARCFRVACTAKKRGGYGHANTLLPLLCTPPLRQLKTNVAYERGWQKIIRKPCLLKRIRWMIWSGYGSIKKSDWQWRGNKGCDDRFFMSRWMLKVIHSLIPKTTSTVGNLLLNTELDLGIDWV